MITEDYVSFETAKLLKEKGFDEECQQYYGNYKYPCPTLQMAMKWLREDKGIAIILVLSSVLDNEKFLWDIEITVAKTNESYLQGWIYEHYEQACEAAIKYCLNNLI